MASKSVITTIVFEHFLYPREYEPTNDTCPAIKNHVKVPPPNRTNLFTNYDWTMQTRYIIKETYSWGALLTRIPAGVFADKFGGKYIVTLSMLLSSFCLIMIPGVIDISTTSSMVGNAMIVGNFLQGTFYGLLYPGVLTVLARWVPSSERTTMFTIVFGTELLGDQLGHVSYNLSVNYTWRSGFYFFGGLGIVWCIFWHLLIYPTSWDNPFIKTKELILLKEELDEDLFIGWKRIPWKKIALSKSVWVLCILQAGNAWGWKTLGAVTKFYIPTVLKGEILWESSWWTSFLLYFCVTMFYGLTVDWILNAKHSSLTTIRKFFATIGNNQNIILHNSYFF